MNAERIKATSIALGFTPRPVWDGDDGALRIGHSGDMVTMLHDLGKETTGAYRVRAGNGR